MKLIRSVASLYLFVVSGAYAAACQASPLSLDQALHQVMHFAFQPNKKTVDDWRSLQPALDVVLDMYPLLDQTLGERDYQHAIDSRLANRDIDSVRIHMNEAIFKYVQHLVHARLISGAEYEMSVLFINVFYDEQIKLIKTLMPSSEFLKDDIASVSQQRDIDLAKIKSHRRQHLKPTVKLVAKL